MAKNPELKSYGGYITQEQEDKLLIYCEKNKITKARAIGFLIDLIDLETLKNQESRLESLEIDFLEFKQTILNRLDNINQDQQSKLATNQTTSNDNGFFDEEHF